MKTTSALFVVALVLGSCSSSDDTFEFTFSTDACDDGRIPTSLVLAVDTETGSELWSQRVPYSLDSPQLHRVDDRLMLTFSSARPSLEPGDPWFGGLAALSTAGEPLWQNVAGPTGRFTVADGIAVLLAQPSIGLATELGIDISDGREVWSHATDILWFDLLGGSIALFAEDNTIRAVEASTGNELWSYGSDGISRTGSLGLEGRAVIPTRELAKYIDVELATGEAVEISASGGGTVGGGVVALTPAMIVSHEEWPAVNDRGKETLVDVLVGYDRATWSMIWHREVANAWGTVWVGDYIVKPGRNIRIVDIGSGIDVAKIPVGHRDKYEFAVARDDGVLVGYDGVIASYSGGEWNSVLIGAATQGAWEVDASRTLVASTRLDGTHQLVMMDAGLIRGLWTVTLDQPADQIVLGQDAAYVVQSDRRCANF